MSRILVVVFSLLMIVSCASKNKDAEIESKSALNHLPSWVLTPEVKGSIAAVGIAPKSKGGIQFQIPQAESDARANIAAQIETEVSRLSKDSLRAARIGDDEQVENVFTQATKTIIKKIPLRGARRINIYKDPEEGSLYVHMKIDSEMVAGYFEDNKKLFSDTLRKSAVDRAKLDDAEKAVEHLYKELDKELD
jgi:hypothetical protein